MILYDKTKVHTSHLAVLIRPFIDIDVEMTLIVAPLQNDYLSMTKKLVHAIVLTF
jgi:hypothetical protein